MLETGCTDNQPDRLNIGDQIIRNNLVKTSCNSDYVHLGKGTAILAK